MIGTIIYLDPIKHCGFLIDDHAVRYFFFHNALSTLGPSFADLTIGTTVRFTPIQDFKQRHVAIEIQVQTLAPHPK